MAEFHQLTKEDVERLRIQLLKYSESNVDSITVSKEWYRDVVITMQNLYNENEKLRKDSVELSWIKSPERMGR